MILIIILAMGAAVLVFGLGGSGSGRGGQIKVRRGPGFAVYLARFAAGLPLDGQHRTDAGWLRHGARILHPTGHASRWAHLPHLHRAGVRFGVLAMLAAVCVGLRADARQTIIWGSVAAGLIAAELARRAVRAILIRAHVRRYVRPLHVALAPVLGVPSYVRPQEWLTVPRRFAEIDDARIRLALPPGTLTTADTRKVIATAVIDKLGISDMSIDWQMIGPAPAAIVTMSVPPPARVALADIRPQVETAPEAAPIIGVGRGRKVISADLDADSPHVLVSAGTGGGKSTIVRSLVSQEMRKGAMTVFCDIKRISHAWARGLPNAVIARDIAEIHNVLIAVQCELNRRNELADDLADVNGNIPDEAMDEIGPRLLVVLEEMNATANRLAAYWRRIKEPSDPAVSPAVEALGDILFMGRAVRVNAIAVAQMMTAKATGGPEARENFATRILARYTLNAWKMLVPEVWPMPKSSRHQGRVQVVMAGVARETQVAFFSPAEARELASSGTVAAFGPLGDLMLSGASVPGLSGGPDQASGVGTVPGRPLPPITLRQAIDRGVLTVSLDSVRAARKRDPEFPREIGIQDGAHAYDPAELIRWERNRPRSIVVTDDLESEIAAGGE